MKTIRATKVVLHLAYFTRFWQYHSPPSTQRQGYQFQILRWLLSYKEMCLLDQKPFNKLAMI